MDIWILVGILLLISIVLFVMSIFAEDNMEAQEEIDRLVSSQMQEMNRLNTRLADLEQQTRQMPVDEDMYSEATTNFEIPEVAPKEEPLTEAEIASISDEDRERIIYLYTHGYLMHEIAEDVGLSTKYIENVVDDYIVNR